MRRTKQYNEGKGCSEKGHNQISKKSLTSLQLHHLGMFNCHAGYSIIGIEKTSNDNTSKHCPIPLILLSFNLK